MSLRTYPLRCVHTNSRPRSIKVVKVPVATSVPYEHHTGLGAGLGLSFYATFILRKETWMTCHIYNKNAFQQDAYRPLHWPSRGEGVCPGGVCLGVSARGCTPSSPPMDRMTDPCENITFPQLLLRMIINVLPFRLPSHF